MAKTIAEIDAEIQKLKNKKARLAQLETDAQRRKRTRQAAILGGWLMTNDQAAVEKIKARLTRPQDMAAFDIKPAASVPQLPPSLPASSAPGG